jgi:5-methylcytosine-specific restriction endonuclease McrA
MPNDPHYKTKKHRHWRECVLRKAEYLCEECKKYGRMEPATHAHHIQSREDSPHLQYIISNGQALCTSCHNKIEPRDKNGNSNNTYR